MHWDVIVIGSGQAGVPLSTRLAGAGKRVLLAERAELGGTCINYGCTPTKTMVASARAAHVARAGGRLGVHAASVAVDFPAVVRRKDDVVRQWQEGVAKRLEAAGERLRVARAHARFVGPRAVDVGGERHTADVVVLNVGTRPKVPPLPGLDAVPWLDNRRVMALPALPSHLLVLGGGYIGCEFAQMFRRFGAEVTVVGRAPHLLDQEDADVSEQIEAVFRDEGVALVLGAKTSKVERDGDGVALTLADGKRLRGSHLLVSVGRTPNADDLGCDAAGVARDARGYVTVDQQYRTSAEGVYAVGDVTGGPAFTHTSWDDHRRLYDLLTGRSSRGSAGRIVPYAVFTDPPVASVGLNERTAKAQGVEYELATMPFGRIARAIETDERAGLLKVLIDPRTEKILGASIVGLEAGELLHTFVALMEAGASARAVVDMEVVHPTLAEGLQSVLMTLPRFALS